MQHLSRFTDIRVITLSVLISGHSYDLLSCPYMETSQPYRVYTPESLGAAIRHYRTEAGLSQAELAERAGLNRTYLSNLESGKETEQVRRILRVLRQLGVRMTLAKADW
jgi:DNA-binding XRE family transcriptional regulator